MSTAEPPGRFAAALGFAAADLLPGAKTADPLKVAVLCGGLGPERDVSLNGGPTVRDALRGRGHDARLLELPDSHEDAVDALMTLDGAGFDVAFPVLHGPFGEDGRCRTVLDRLGLPATGSGVWSSVLSYRKRLAKMRWSEVGLPTPPWAETFRGQHDLDAGELPDDIEEWIFPAVVKPDAGGSSDGVTLVRGVSELPAALATAFESDEIALCEGYVPGAEWSVPVLGGVALPPLRITPGGGGLFDRASKYADDRTRIEPVTNAPGESEAGDTAAKVSELAVAAAEAIFAEGLVRVDVRVGPDGSAWLLELNANPGLSSRSQVPRSAAAAGIPAGVLYERCCRLALSPE